MNDILGWVYGNNVFCSDCEPHDWDFEIDEVAGVKK